MTPLVHGTHGSTHFLLIDNGKAAGAAWGGEIGLRSAIEAAYSESRHVPIVLLVVQGGPGTLATVAATAKNHNPIVLLVDSGGAASAIHAYVKGGIDAVEQRMRGGEEQLKVIKSENDICGGKVRCAGRNSCASLAASLL